MEKAWRNSDYRSILTAFRVQVERETLERVWKIFPVQSESNDTLDWILDAIKAEFAPKGEA